MEEKLGIIEDYLKSGEAEKIKKQFLEFFVQMGDILSLSHFDDFNEILKAEGVTFLKTDPAIDFFKQRLVNDLTSGFENVWDLYGISQNLAVLNFLKEQFKGQTKPQWRPYGKSVQEQTLPIRVRLLEKKFRYLDKHLIFQKERLESLVAEVESMRKYIADIKERREILLHSMESRMEKDDELRRALTELTIKAVDLNNPAK